MTKDRLPQAGNRSVLMHALDSANPHMMTRAFLECGQFKYINRDFNLFMDGEYTYSPTKYVEKARIRLLDGTPVRAVPAISGGRLFARDRSHLVCVDLRAGK